MIPRLLEEMIQIAKVLNLLIFKNVNGRPTAALMLVSFIAKVYVEIWVKILIPKPLPVSADLKFLSSYQVTSQRASKCQCFTLTDGKKIKDNPHTRRSRAFEFWY